MTTDKVKDSGDPNSKPGRWEFWIDRGGTFTDIVAKTPDAELITHKLLSDNPAQYRDAAVQGIRDVMKIEGEGEIPLQEIGEIRIGTTVATNALLERKGTPTLFLTTKGFRDALVIGSQSRPDIFALRIDKPDMLYADVLEAHERIDHRGNVLEPLAEDKLREDLSRHVKSGITSIAIAFIHGYEHSAHEQIAARIAEEAGFAQISVSHEVSALIKFIPRASTTVVDAYLSPILGTYVDTLVGELSAAARDRLSFMQSNGGLTDANGFRGKNAILSGPAGGVVGMVETAHAVNRDKVIGFDMGGTSTDVSHFAGTYERVFDTQVAGTRLSAPMMHVETIAAGGGSLLEYDGMRMRVGPKSAGAFPGPAAYRNGGPLTVTDANIMVGKIVPATFPHVFGPCADQPLDKEKVTEKFEKLAQTIGGAPEAIADGFIQIAVQNMAASIRKISVQRGYDVSNYVLNCFGGAGAQHACLVADALGMKEILIHPFASLLSAYGIGLAVPRTMREASINLPLSDTNLDLSRNKLDTLQRAALSELIEQGFAPKEIEIDTLYHLRYEGTDNTLSVKGKSKEALQTNFEERHRALFGFAADDVQVVIDSVSLEASVSLQREDDHAARHHAPGTPSPAPTHTEMFTAGGWHTAPHITLSDVGEGEQISGPAVLIDPHTTIVVEPDWVAARDPSSQSEGPLFLRREESEKTSSRTDRLVHRQHTSKPDPVLLEIFNSLFMSVAEQMGFTLQNTSVSVNIKERLDFSCALFTPDGALVANAPHIPVHLGSMGTSVKAVLDEFSKEISAGDVFVLNDPFQGGTHLPDVTVVAPVFDEAGDRILFFVAARGHHAEIGGMTPGSMPALSKQAEEEGVLLPPMKLIEAGVFGERAIRDLLSQGPYPSRQIDLNIADLKAQCAACEKGAQELRSLARQYGYDTVRSYMGHVQKNAEESVRRVISTLKDGTFTLCIDEQRTIKVALHIDSVDRSAVVDFTGTSAQLPNNFNAPSSITRAAVLYVFRCLVSDDIPLNDGCLMPIKIILPEGCFLNPVPPAAVVAGNVETSQNVCDALFGALGILASSQSTMNNVSFGNADHQYYETVCGGAGAGSGFNGADAVQTHMTNSRLTDPEILESRFPVRVQKFSVRQDSGGTGKWSGGCGATRHLVFDEDVTVSLLTSNRLSRPFGLEGAGSGRSGQNKLIKRSGIETILKSCDTIEAEAGDAIVIETPGGGGYGTPP